MQRRLWKYLIIVASIALIAVLGLYVYEFGYGSDAHLSNDTDEWARFGEYFGGALGAFYGLLAFVGVIFSISIQQSQSVRDELQQLMAMVRHRIDELFDAPLRNVEPDVRKRIEESGQNMTLFSALSALGVAAIDRTVANRDELLRRGRLQITHDASLVCIELQQLVLLLQSYENVGGNSAILEFYVSRYGIPVAWLQGIGLLNSDIVARYFQASERLSRMQIQYVSK